MVFDPASETGLPKRLREMRSLSRLSIIVEATPFTPHMPAPICSMRVVS
jgi:hypothetical protein